MSIPILILAVLLVVVMLVVARKYGSLRQPKVYAWKTVTADILSAEDLGPQKNGHLNKEAHIYRVQLAHQTPSQRYEVTGEVLSVGNPEKTIEIVYNKQRPEEWDWPDEREAD